MNRAAVIVIGSNSTRLLSADMEAGLPHPLRGREETRLFLSLQQDGRLSPEGMAQTAEAVKRLKDMAVTSGANEVYLLATSATRDAKNRKDFETLLLQKAGLTLGLLSGEEEARLAFIGASGLLPQGTRGVLDIGGGSTEVVAGEKEIDAAHSLQMGAGRLMKMQRVDCLEDVPRAQALAEKVINTLPQLHTQHWAMMGGTGTVLMHMLLGVPLGSLVPEVFPARKEDAQKMLHLLARTPREKRGNIPGLPPERIDIMPTGLVILLTVMEQLNIQQINITTRNNTDGFLMDLLLKGQQI